MLLKENISTPVLINNPQVQNETLNPVYKARIKYEKKVRTRNILAILKYGEKGNAPSAPTIKVSCALISNGVSPGANTAIHIDSAKIPTS
jgi:hypothetical protein